MANNASDVTLTVDASPEKVPPSEEPRLVKVRVVVRPSEQLRATHREGVKGAEGVDVCVVLDTSGSMEIVIAGEHEPIGTSGVVEDAVTTHVRPKPGHTLVTKLDACKAAVKPLIGLLHPADTLSVIHFDVGAEIICQDLGASDAARFNGAIDALKANRDPKRNTEMGKGLRAAAQQLAKGPSGKTKKVILFTDGEATDGRAAVQEGQTIADRGWSIDCLGLGENHNRVFLQEVVGPSLGRTEPLAIPKWTESRPQSPDEARQLFQSAVNETHRLFESVLKRTQQVVATNLRLTLTFSSQVVVGDWYRGAPENLHQGKLVFRDDSRRCLIVLGNLERNQAYSYYFYVRIPPQRAQSGVFRIGTAELSYDLPGQRRSGSTAPADMIVTIRSAPLPAWNGDIEAETKLCEMKRIEKERDAAAEKGDLETAMGKCDELAEFFQSKRDEAGVALAQQAKKDIAKNGKVSPNVVTDIATKTSKPAESNELAELPADGSRSPFPADLR